MKKGMIISVVLLSVVFLFGCGQNQSSQAQTSSINDSLAVNKINTDNKIKTFFISILLISFNPLFPQTFHSLVRYPSNTHPAPV